MNYKVSKLKASQLNWYELFKASLICAKIIPTIAGKVFPKLRRKANSLSSTSSTSSGSTTSMEDEEAMDYVFRVVTSFKPDSIS